MKTVIHKADSRGNVNFGWLQSRHSFSFGNYYNPERMSFGLLRVLNDDIVAPGMGFGKHPHDNMEIISIPLHGDLEHKDSLGNTTVIKEGDVQAMTAGSGIYHSEYNKNKDKEVRFLQIWVFPKERDVTPSYDQISLRVEDRHNKLQQIVSPDKNESGVTINQDAWFHLSEIDKGVEIKYELKGRDTGVYIFVLEGDLSIDQQQLNKRDGMGISGISSLHIKADTDSQVLLMEVPMN
ncbi:pirin family protein [Leptobacterium flavescens]|uniref:Pirin family protein n=1 Tax=Leptobacterium flavescens TaxID=472055 RepID=A0A6P0UN09_9FLAO|nr:pirin family protein [Leptobacterium flavescens]NER12393.1 pirin family protein [Leptobacterium flavescens]